VDGNFGGGGARNFGEIGFAGSRTSDTTYFDDIVVRYIINPEPLVSLGTEEGQANNRLDVDGEFLADLSTYSLDHIQTVEVQIRYRVTDTGEKWHLKAYNWTSLTYSDSGFNSTEGHTPTTGWNYYAVNLTDKWKSYVYNNGTIRVKVLDESTDTSQTTIDIDFLAVRTMIDGARFTLQNKGSATLHVVSLWIDNATLHQRYDINFFINAGDKAYYDVPDASLPDRPFVAKLITEKGTASLFRVP
jgi:hypothetical protein